MKTRRRRNLRLFLAALSLFLAVPAFGQQAVLHPDPGKTVATFTLHDVLHTVRGTFRLKSGAVTLDRATGKITGLVVIDATSGDSGNRGREGRMHREILESAKYPEICFTPVEVKGDLAPQGDSRVEIRGAFAMHGEQHDIVIPADVHIAGSELTADAKFPLTYVQWGVKNPSNFVLRVSDTVQIEIRAAGQLGMPAAN